MWTWIWMNRKYVWKTATEAAIDFCRGEWRKQLARCFVYPVHGLKSCLSSSARLRLVMYMTTCSMPLISRLKPFPLTFTLSKVDELSSRYLSYRLSFFALCDRHPHVHVRPHSPLAVDQFLPLLQYTPGLCVING